MITSGIFWAALLLGAVVYWLLPRGRSSFLFAVSAGYVAYLDWKGAVVLLVLSLLAFICTQVLECRYRWLTILTGVLVGTYLAFYKYLPPLLPLFTKVDEDAPAVAVPIGASYFTFKLIHYLVECQRKHIQKHDLPSFLSYMFFAPMFTAGPIERFEDFLKNRAPNFQREHLYQGGTRIMYGLIKKLVVVDLFLSREIKHKAMLSRSIPLIYGACPVDQLLEDLPKLHPFFVWQFVINHYVWWYVDFSAYSDIAIGLGLLYGIKLQENFNNPFFVTNIGEFWRRYHISLSNWCQRYVYFPMLGWTRNANLALFSSMIAMGLWHAGNLNYIVWGFYQASMLSIYTFWTRYKRRRIGNDEEGTSQFTRITTHPAFGIAGGVLTFLGTCASSAMPSTQEYGLRAAARVLAALIGIDIPPAE